MSIAISFVLRSSKILRYCTAFFSFLLLLIGIYIASLDHISILERSIFIALCAFAAGRGFMHIQRLAKKRWHITIDGKGQLYCHSGSLTKNRSFKLVTGTTLWTQALFLCLYNQEENSRITLLILPDALSKDEFRRLSVACKWMAARLR